MKTKTTYRYRTVSARPATRRLLSGLVLALVWGGTTMAGQLVYTPVNPSFGGNPFNGPYLMSIAQQQASKNAPNPLGDAFTDLTSTLDNICTAVNCENPSTGAASPDTGLEGAQSATTSAPINSGVIE